MVYHTPTDIERIRNTLRELNHAKWGFVIYRCTYEDDNAWARFMEIIKKRARNRLTDDGRDLFNGLEWTVRDDRATLDGASVDKIRDLLKAWVASDAAKAEESNSSHLRSTPRYVYCIHVDAVALDSVVRLAPQPPLDDWEGAGYVDLIDSWWEPDPHDEQNPDDEENPEDPDVGWMKVSVQGLLPSAYAMLQKRDAYYVVYKPPPEIWNR